MRGSHDHGGGDCGKGDEQRPHPKKNDTYKSDGKNPRRLGDMERKIEASKRGGCYTCGGPHSYALMNIGVILRKQKEKVHMSKSKVRR